MNRPFKISAFKNELHEILNWWSTYMLDEQNGGFIGRVDGQGKKHPKADKAVILNTRILWTFSAAWNAGYKEYEAICHRSFHYILDHFVDSENGGLFWMLDYLGNPINKRKQVYAQAFGIYAMTEYFHAFGDQNAKKLAMELFELLEIEAFDSEKGGYYEAFGEKWEKIKDVRLSRKDENDVKTMNTHLHILEAYTNLYKHIKETRTENSLRKLITTYCRHFIDKKSYRLQLFFDEDWNENLNHHSFGHEIESVWLLHEAAEALEDDQLMEGVQKMTLPMAHRVLMEGMTPEGGIFNEKSLDNHYNGMKDWWPLAEAVIGFYDVWQKTQNKAYLDSSKSCWKFILNHIKDHEKGEWHWGVDSENRIQQNEDKAGPWKAPYHNVRMCLEMIRRLK